ncbi:MAG: hypothetical protein JXA06_04780 [Bacteroidetes bacterium]|nr:hypothetical protein [Bacteroidota bacterium]
MKPANVPPSKELKIDSSVRRKFSENPLKSKYKNQAQKRQRFIVNANAGHVRGGHSFH